jgi:asparagine synthetase B (glutamine-hydrolysing)
VTLSDEDRQLVLETLDAHAELYNAKEVDGVTSLFARDSDVALFGTGAEELWLGYEDVRRQFARNVAEAEAVQFEWTWRHRHQANDSDSVSGAPERLEGEGTWVHRHASVAVGGQGAGVAYPMSDE